MAPPHDGGLFCFCFVLDHRRYLIFDFSQKYTINRCCLGSNNEGVLLAEGKIHLKYPRRCGYNDGDQSLIDFQLDVRLEPMLAVSDLMSQPHDHYHLPVCAHKVGNRLWRYRR